MEVQVNKRWYQRIMEATPGKILRAIAVLPAALFLFAVGVYASLKEAWRWKRNGK